MSREPRSAPRCLAVWAVATLAASLLLAWLLPHLARGAVSPSAVPTFEDWLVTGCAAAAAVGVGWLWLLVSLVVLEAAGTSATRRGVPTGVRRMVLAACGVGLAGGLAVPAYAAPPSLDGLPMPDRPAAGAVVRPSGPATPAATGSAAGPVRPARTVRVAAGDTLWDLAVADLPAGATDAEVATRWRAVHAANREVIGADPDLIRPGQQLRLPPAPPSA